MQKGERSQGRQAAAGGLVRLPSVDGLQGRTAPLSNASHKSGRFDGTLSPTDLESGVCAELAHKAPNLTEGEQHGRSGHYRLSKSRNKSQRNKKQQRHWTISIAISNQLSEASHSSYCEPGSICCAIHAATVQCCTVNPPEHSTKR